MKTEPLTDAQLDELERLADAAIIPWNSTDLHKYARNALPALIAEIRAARASVSAPVASDGTSEVKS